MPSVSVPFLGVPSPATGTPFEHFIAPKTISALFAIRVSAIDPKLGALLLRCATDRRGFRCQQSLVCARCAPRASKKQRKALESRLMDLPSGTRLVLVTLTANAPDIVAGRTALLEAFAMLRRRECWSAVVVGGRGQIEVVPSPGGTWHVHLHALAELRAGRRMARTAVDAAWRRLLPSGIAGKVDLRPVTRTWADASRAFSPPAFYCIKRGRSAWLDYSGNELRALVDALPRRRWSVRWGRQ